MNKYQLESRIRSVGIAYVLFFVAGAHYAYLNKWGTQVFFWLTLGGLGIWWLVDIFRITGMVHDFNDPLFNEIEWIEKEERDRDDFKELRKMRAQRSGNLLEDNWRQH